MSWLESRHKLFSLKRFQEQVTTCQFGRKNFILVERLQKGHVVFEVAILGCMECTSIHRLCCDPTESYQAMMANLYQEEHLRRVGSPINRAYLETAHTSNTGFWYKVGKWLGNIFFSLGKLEALQESPALDYLKARHKVLIPKILPRSFTFVLSEDFGGHILEKQKTRQLSPIQVPV